MKSTPIHLGNMTADLNEIRPMREKLSQALMQTELASDTQQHVLLAFSEWTTNLIKYNQPKSIWLEFEKSLTHFTLTILDDGPSFKDINNRFANADSAIEPNNFSEGGRGLFIIKEYFPDFSYITEANNNCFSVSIGMAHKPRIAIVEDDVSVSQLLSVFLSDQFRIETFIDAPSALAAIQSTHFDLVISDISMPGMDGFDLKKQLSNIRETNLLPFIFLTSSEDEKVEDQAADLGIDDYLHKPVTKQHLHTVIKRVLKRKQQAGDLLDQKVTESLHPNLPSEINGIRLANVSQSASAGGGDFIVHMISPERDVIILGDVMGHGLDAKFFAHVYAGYIQGLIKSLSPTQNASDLLTKLSALVSDDSYLESVIVTCLVLTIEKNGVIHIANAGHPKPIVLTNGVMNTIDVSGTLLGLNPDTRYEQIDITLKESRLLVYTDGLFEIGSSQEVRESNMNKMEKCIKKSAGKSLDVAVGDISKEFNILCGNNPQDDMTLLMLAFS